jgi:hypothetical protein
MMIAETQARAGTAELSWQAAEVSFKEHESANWTCYSAGETTPEWVLLAAENASTPVEILEMLAESCNIEVRMAVADNPAASVDTMMLLAEDTNADLRYQIAENHNIDKSVLKLLTDDSHPYVAHRAQKTLKRLEVQADATVLSFPVLTLVQASKNELGKKLQRTAF